MNTFIFSEKINSIAIGGFDGVHIAHQALFKELDSENGAVIIINMNKAKITPNNIRCRYIKKYKCIFYNINDIKSLDGKEFIELLKKNLPNLRKIVVGYDFNFGKGRKYKAKDIKKFYQYEVKIIDEIKIDNISVHSEVIRQYIQNGNIKRATKFLGHTFIIDAVVIKGQGIGKKKLVPTLNLKVSNDYVRPKNGVYAIYTYIGKRKYKGVCFIGNRLTIDNSFGFEIHLIGENIHFKVKEVEVEFIDFIRDNKKFKSINRLKLAIQNDIKIAKEILK